MILAIIIVPDLANLLPTTWITEFDGQQMNAPWVLWLALMQLSLAAWCLVVIKLPRIHGTKLLLTGAAVWYTLQAVDEVVEGNFFRAGLWEYPVLVVYFGSLLYYIHTHEPHEKPT